MGSPPRGLLGAQGPQARHAGNAGTFTVGTITIGHPTNAASVPFRSVPRPTSVKNGPLAGYSKRGGVKMAFKSYKDESRKNYGTYDGTPADEQIKTGAILRIADALERITKPFHDTLREAEVARAAAARMRSENERLLRSNAALRGYVKRVKRIRKGGAK